MHSRSTPWVTLLTALASAAPLNNASEKRSTDGWTCYMMETNNVKGTVTLGSKGGSAVSGYSWTFGHSLQIQPPSGGYVSSWSDTTSGDRTINTDITHLPAPVVWDSNVYVDACSVTYAEQTTQGTMASEGGSVGPFYSDSTTFCAVSFPCDPPAVTTGWCGVHLKQDKRTPNLYIVDVKDAAGFAVGTGGNVTPPGETLSIGTVLGHSLDIGSSANPDDAVTFNYNGYAFDSSSCSVGAYDEIGMRQMDCGFTC